MLNGISWGSYWTALSIVLLCYYGWIGWRYRGQWLQRATPVSPGLLPLDPSLHPQAVACQDELFAYLTQIRLNHPSRNEVVFGLHKIFQHYPQLAGTVYQDSISQWLVAATREQCAIHLSEEDVRQVWLV